MALVLKRRAGEAVWVGDCRITVGRVEDNRVILVFDAPPGVEIWRAELVDRTQTGMHEKV